MTDTCLPTPDALRRDLRLIGVKGLRKALATPLPALAILPSIESATAAGDGQRDTEIETLLHSALGQLDETLAVAGTTYLFGRQEHNMRLKAASDVLEITEKSFERRRREELEPLLARALLNIAESKHQIGRGVAATSATDLEDEPPQSELFAACPEGERFRDRELAAIADRKASVWWREASADWFGSYFASWCKVGAFPCEKVRLIVSQGSYYARRFGFPSALDGPKEKLTIVSTTWFGTDASDYEIHCGITNYGFAFRWAKNHADQLLRSRSSPSIFGATDRLAYPGIAGVHTLMQTADGYLLFGLRGTKTVTYHELTWSASFEESIAYASDGQDACDKTVRDTIVRGLRDEWGVPASALATSTTLAVGREFVRIDETRLDLSASILTAIRLGIDLTTVWNYLGRSRNIIDIDEHCAWVAVRFASRADLLQFLRFARERTHGYDLFREFASSHPSAGEIAFYPNRPDTGIEDRGLMPTSAARLYLGSKWLGEY